MEHPLIRQRLIAQNGVIATWQMLADGVPPGAIRHAIRSMRQVHDGVYLSGHARPTDHQRLLAAAFTAPNTAVDRWSAAWFYGLRDNDTGPVTILRRGTGGPISCAARFDPRLSTGRDPEGEAGSGPQGDIGRGARGESGSEAPGDTVLDPRWGLSIRRAAKLHPDDLSTQDGIPMVTGARTVLDLLGLYRKEERQARLVRDALRLEVVRPVDLHQIAARHAGRRGVRVLRGMLDRYALLPATDAKSDAEILAVELLVRAGFPRPRLNVLVEGEEGDLVWVARRHIVELDSDGFHPFPEVDERKRRVWAAAGWTWGCVATDHVYEAPERLYAAAAPVLA